MKAIRWEAFFFVAVLLWLIVWMSVSSQSSVKMTCVHQDRPPLQTWACRADEYGFSGSLIGTVKFEHTHIQPTFFFFFNVSVCVGGCECVYVCAAFQCFVPLKMWKIYLKPIWFTVFVLVMMYFIAKYGGWKCSHAEHCSLLCFDRLCVMEHYPP